MKQSFYFIVSKPVMLPEARHGLTFIINNPRNKLRNIAKS